jgi:hypothetical protein
MGVGIRGRGKSSVSVATDLSDACHNSLLVETEVVQIIGEKTIVIQNDL